MWAPFIGWIGARPASSRWRCPANVTPPAAPPSGITRFRRYLALVEGVPKAASGSIDLPIADEYASGKRHIARDDDEPSREAVTHYRIRERFPRAALLEVERDTGRQHQIRLHPRAIGHPIVGDGVYGGKPRSAGSRPLLHACKLAFPHPLTGAPVDCESEPPGDFADALRKVRDRASRPPGTADALRVEFNPGSRDGRRAGRSVPRPRSRR